MEIRRLIREMSLANRLWGAPRIHGELLTLGIEVARSTVAKYMARSGRGREQTWKTFLHNHVSGIGAMDFLVVPTINFQLLFVLVIVRHERRRLISLSVTDHPTAEWIARQITDAFPWDEAPDYMVRDRPLSPSAASMMWADRSHAEKTLQRLGVTRRERGLDGSMVIYWQPGKTKLSADAFPRKQSSSFLIRSARTGECPGASAQPGLSCVIASE